MKLFKKVMSLIIASIMMLQVAAFAAPAPADVNGTYYENAAKLLSALEIMVGDGESFNGDKNVTRAEFTKIMVATAGLADVAAAYKAKGMFTDVPDSEWYAPYVEFGKDMGAINGMGDGTFAPNNNVTGEQAVKMMVCIVGYGIQAAEMGYPEGYVSVARDLGALKGITSVDLTKPMTRGQAAVLASNILRVDLLKQVTVGDKEEWISKDGVNLLSDKFDSYEVEGIVSANDTTAIWNTSDLKPGQVEITVGSDRKLLYAGETDIATKIGSVVKFVYQYDSFTDDSTVLSYEASERKNVAVTVDFKAFDRTTAGALNFNSATREYSYWEDEDAKKPKKVKIESMPAILYNGVAATRNSQSAEAFLQSKANLIGEVTFLDANSVDGAETLMITAYENYVIDYIDTETYTLVDDNNSARMVPIDIENENVVATFVDKDGKELSFDSLQAGDVISVAESASTGKKAYHVIVCDDTVSGIVMAMGDNEDGIFSVELDDGKQYLFDHIMDADNAKKAKLSLGKEASFKLDAFGQVAALETGSETSKGEFGFLIDFVPAQGTEGSYLAKVFTANSEYMIYPFATKVIIDGNKCTSPGAIDTAIKRALNDPATAYTGGTRPATPMLYELDANGAIKYVDTPYDDSAEDDSALGAIKGFDTSIATRLYSQYYKGFDNMIQFNDKALVLAVPQDGDFEDPKKLYFMKKADFKDKNYQLQLFNTDRDSYAYTFGICVLDASTSGSNAFQTGVDDSAQRKRPLFVVNKTTLTLVLDDEGEDIATLKVYGNEEGAEKTITIDPDYYANGAYDLTGNLNTVLNHVYYGITFDETGTTRKFGTGNDGINFNSHLTRPMSTNRQTSIILPGDIFTYGVNEEGYVQYVRPIFLHEEKAFLSQNYYEASTGRVYGAIDVAIPVEIDGKDARFDKISDTAKDFNEFMMETIYDPATGMITRDYNGNSIVGTRTVAGTGAGVTQTYYDPDKLSADDVRTLDKVKIIVVDMAATNANNMVKTGSITDIVDARNATRPATPCIIRNFNSAYASIVVFKNL